MAPQAVQVDGGEFFSSHIDIRPYQKEQGNFNDNAKLESFPTSLHSPLAWTKEEFKDEDSYTYHLTGDQLKEVDSALQHFKELGLDAKEINQSNFPLPSLKNKLRELALELHEGRGFFVIRGLQPRKYTKEDNVLINLGVSSYIGELRGQQDNDGNILMHIRNAHKMLAPQAERPGRDSNLSLAYHTDLFCDIIALQTLGCSEEGGNHLLASTYTIYNQLAATHPDLVALLAKPIWLFDPRSLFAKPVKRPCLFYHDNHMILNYGRNRLLHLHDPEGYRQIDSKYSLESNQLEALDALQALAESNQLELKMQPGDLTYINNFSILHARDSFVDTPENSRHLVRLWLKNEGMAWKLPVELQAGNVATYASEKEDVWDILGEPKITYKVEEKFTP